MPVLKDKFKLEWLVILNHDPSECNRLLSLGTPTIRWEEGFLILGTPTIRWEEGKLWPLNPRLIHPFLKLLVSLARLRVSWWVHVICQLLFRLELNRFVKQSINRVETFPCEFKLVHDILSEDFPKSAVVVFSEFDLYLNGMAIIFQANSCQTYEINRDDLETQVFVWLNDL